MEKHARALEQLQQIIGLASSKQGQGSGGTATAGLESALSMTARNGILTSITYQHRANDYNDPSHQQPGYYSPNPNPFTFNYPRSQDNHYPDPFNYPTARPRGGLLGYSPYANSYNYNYQSLIPNPFDYPRPCLNPYPHYYPNPFCCPTSNYYHKTHYYPSVPNPHYPSPTPSPNPTRYHNPKPTPLTVPSTPNTFTSDNKPPPLFPDEDKVRIDRSPEAEQEAITMAPTTTRTEEQENKLKSWKTELINYLTICKLGNEVSKIPGQILEVVGERIPFAKMGCETLGEFLYECRDAIEVGILFHDQPTTYRKFVFLRAAAVNKETADIRNLVANQEKGKPKRRNDGTPSEPSRNQVKMIDPKWLLQDLRSGQNNSTYSTNRFVAKTPYQPANTRNTVGKYRNDSYSAQKYSNKYNAKSSASTRPSAFTRLGTNSNTTARTQPAASSTGGGWKFSVSQPSTASDSTTVPSWTTASQSGPRSRLDVTPHPQKMRFMPSGLDDDEDWSGESESGGLEYFSGTDKTPEPAKAEIIPSRTRTVETSFLSRLIRPLDEPFKKINGNNSHENGIGSGGQSSLNLKRGYDQIDGFQKKPTVVSQDLSGNNDSSNKPIPNAYKLDSNVIISLSRPASIEPVQVGKSSITEIKNHSLKEKEKETVENTIKLAALKLSAVEIDQTKRRAINGISAPASVLFEMCMGIRPPLVPKKGQLWQIMVLNVKVTPDPVYNIIFRIKKEHDAFTSLEKHIQTFYDSEAGTQLTVRENPDAGFYAGRCKVTDQWFRVQVRAKVSESSSSTEVLACDYGSVITVDLANGGLCHLQEVFCSVPRTAYFGKIVGSEDVSILRDLLVKAQKVPVNIICEGFTTDKRSSTNIIYVSLKD